MASTLGTLTLDLIARIGGFTAPLDQASAAARKSAEDIADSADLAGVAWDALGEVFAGALAGLSVGAIFGTFIAETQQAEKEQAQLAAVLRSTGEAAGFSRDQLNEMADAMQDATTISGGDVNQAQTALLAFTGVVGDQFTRALQSAGDMAARTGSSIQQSAETIGRALDVPSEGLSSLSKQGFRFTEEQKKLVEAFESTGDAASAQGIILKALEDTYGGAAVAARGTFGGALESLQNTISGLMTGEGSLEGARVAIEGLNEALQSPAVSTAIELTAKAATALAVVLATRLAASVITTSFAFAAGQVEVIRYHLALARMAGVAPGAAAGLVGVGVAARGASAAMALLGGPTGVVLLAASALAYFVMSGDEAEESASSLSGKVDLLSQSFDGFTKHQAAAALQDINKELLDAQIRAIDAESAVGQYQRLLREHPTDARQREWNESLISAQGELDTARQKVEAFGEQINVLNGILSAPDGVIQSKVFRDLAKSLDEQILLVGKKTNAEKLSARIGAGLVVGLKQGEGELLIAKAKVLDASEAAADAEKKRTEAAKKAATAAATAEAAIRKRGEEAITDYQRQIELISTDIGKKKEATEVAKLLFELESGKLQGLSEQRKERLAQLAEELDRLKKLKQANEDDKAVRGFQFSTDRQLNIDQRSLDSPLLNAYDTDQVKQRVLELLAIEQGYQDQLEDLRKRHEDKDISDSVYERETEILESALNKRLAMQQKYYGDIDRLQQNGTAGFVSGFATQAQAASDLYGNMQAVGGQAFRSLTDALTQWAETGKLDVKSFAASFIKSIGHTLLTYAAAQVAMAGLSAFSAMVGIPFVGPFVAPGAAIAATAAAGVLMTAVGGALDGQAHDGIDYVPADGTWNLKKGERVTTAQTSAKLDRTLDQVRASSANPGSGGTVVNIIADSEKAGAVNKRTGPDGRDETDVYVADIYGGGKRAQALEAVYGLRRSGV